MGASGTASARMQLFPYYTALITLSIQRADYRFAVRPFQCQEEGILWINFWRPAHIFRVDMSLCNRRSIISAHRVWIIGGVASIDARYVVQLVAVNLGCLNVRVAPKLVLKPGNVIPAVRLQLIHHATCKGSVVSCEFAAIC